VGEIIHVPTSRITLLGHRRGTTLRGCDPDGFGIILANLHPDRLAGLIFMGGPPTPDLFELWDADSTGMLAMAPRLFFSADGLDPDEAIQRMRARHEEAAPHRRLDGQGPP